MRKTFLAALLLTAGGLALAPLAHATPTLGLQLAESGFATVSTSSTTDPLVLNQSPYGTYTVNVEVNTVGLNPLSIDLGSTNTTTTGGTLVITASVNGLTSPIGLANFLTQFSGHIITGGPATVTLQSYIDTTNTLFGTGTALSSLTMPPFGFTSGNASGTTVSPFALTEVMTISVASGTSASLSLDGSTSVPEPGSLLLLGTALIGIGAVGFARRRRA